MTLLESNMKNVSQQCYNSNINKTKGDIMSALKYNIETLLEGKYYHSRSRRLEGIIQYAEKREGIWYGEGLEAYVIQVRPTYSSESPLSKDFWATVCVSA